MENFTGKCFKDNNGKYILVIEDIDTKTMLKVIEIDLHGYSIKLNKIFFYGNLYNIEKRSDGIKFIEIEREDFNCAYEFITTQILKNFSQ